ncbi:MULTISPECIES: hypothetical protein [unclassified Microbacterium]|uniref:hypothetical protein n=1 Tax=unclassified Microbacterium TaxID=2609290 RepID=UPI0024695BE4|nr:MULTISPECIES: hypothetical protein [unclassified Microbacterium]MDH5134044.1 hypothetical protein [Microbacterium sp. RD10]MDH5136852.1 hypothetical protein [Microbacterium sp. RD11]MDH5146884.1 hypothetical protein [Microbacterium sp. RD12]MDH5156590.1 hypothetical protein [Microbacterium sp. RD06]MDH5168071.1 hypothetical protein [Microbacterium sp. RD02]
MTDYTPTTEEVKSAALSYSAIMSEADWDSWLAAHDAEVRAGAVAEEPEWEVGVSYSTPSAPSIDGYRLRSYMKVDSVDKAQEFAALVERPMIQKRTKAVPAGEWVSVPVKQEGADQ